MNERGTKWTVQDMETAFEEFRAAFRDFEKAARRLIGIMEDLTDSQGNEPSSQEVQRASQFILQVQDDAGEIHERILNIALPRA